MAKESAILNRGALGGFWAFAYLAFAGAPARAAPHSDFREV